MITDFFPKGPKPPSILHMVAVLLELAIVTTFIANRSLFGVALCVAYCWFSATYALFERLMNDD